MWTPITAQTPFIHNFTINPNFNPSPIPILTPTCSVLTGNPKYRKAADHAARALHAARSTPLGLVGSTVSLLNGQYVNKVATTGPLSDSYYEYLIKVSGTSIGDFRFPLGDIIRIFIGRQCTNSIAPTEPLLGSYDESWYVDS